MRRASRGREDSVQVLRRCREALLIIGLAANAAHDHEPGGRTRLKGERRADHRRNRRLRSTHPHLRRRKHPQILKDRRAKPR